MEHGQLIGVSEKKATCDKEDETGAFELADKLVSRVIQLRQALDRKLEDIEGKEGFLVECQGFQEQAMTEIENYHKKKLVKKLVECQGFQEQVMTEIENYQKLVKKLYCFPPESYAMFDSMIQAAGPRTAEFMRCFDFTINAHCHPELAHRRFQYEGTEIKIGRGPLWSILSPPKLETKDYEFLEYLAPAKPKVPRFLLPTMKRLAEPCKITEYEFHWIFLGSLVDGFGPYENEDRVTQKWTGFSPACFENEDSADDEEYDASSDGSSQRPWQRLSSPREIELNTVAKKKEDASNIDCLQNMVQSFLKADTNQYVFETIPAQALMLRVDLAARPVFLLEFGLSLSCLACLLYLTVTWNLNENDLYCLEKDASENGNGCRKMKVKFSYWCLIIFNYIEVCIIVVDLVIWKSRWFGFWNILEALLETSSLAWVLSFTLFDIRYSNGWRWFDFALLMPALSAARWLEFSLLVLHWPAIGIHLMPAILAAFSTESRAVFGCIFLATLAATQTYLGFRVLENDMTFGEYGTWGTFTGFMRMSRALMFAEGDVDHLAGRKQVLVEEPGPEGNDITVIDDEGSGVWGEVGKFSSYFECINIFTWSTLVLGVLLMNTYVGVLSEKYVEINNHKLHYFQSWRAQWSVKALRRRWLIANKCVSIVGRMKLVKSWYYEDSSGVEEGLWVVSPRQAHEKKSNDVQARIEYDVKQDIARIEKKLDLLLQTQTRRM